MYYVPFSTTTPKCAVIIITDIIDSMMMSIVMTLERSEITTVMAILHLKRFYLQNICNNTSNNNIIIITENNCIHNMVWLECKTCLDLTLFLC